MTESTLLPNPPPLETIRVVCRLGLLTADSPEDADAAPDLRAIGGTVRIWSSAPRVVVDEPDSRGRIVFPQAEPYSFRAADGELVDREDRVGVVLTNPLSPGINPQGWTWIAEVMPIGAQSFRVTFGGESPLPPVVDLARTISVAETPGVSTLEQRVMALEAGGGGGTGPGPTLDVSWSGDVLTVNGESSPPLTGPAPTVSWSGDQLVVGGVTGPHLTGPQGPPGSGGGGDSWTLVGPGRPDTPATTGGLITGSEAVGMAYRSTDGAGVGAWEWVKRPTGWVVTQGDTGWRTGFLERRGDTEAQVTSMTGRFRLTAESWHLEFTATIADGYTGWQLFGVNSAWLGTLLGWCGGTLTRIDNHHFGASPSPYWARRASEPITTAKFITSMSNIYAKGTWRGTTTGSAPAIWPTSLPGAAE